MGAKRKLKVKDLAEKYKVTAKEVLHELAHLGIELEQGGTEVPPEWVDLVAEHFEQRDGKKAATAESGDTGNEVHINSPIVVKTLADAIGKKPNEVIQKLMMEFAVMANMNQTVEPEVAVKLAAMFGITLAVDRRDKSEHQDASPVAEVNDEGQDDPAKLKPRPPVVTFLGHVDHGKTSLQDKVRQTNVVKGESGGITQHIGASMVNFKGHPITFIDTPGHAAFTAMRARGANATDIAILVVAANDGFMPQTVEALSHAKAAEVPIIVAMNKMDLPQANPDTVYRQMQENGLFPEPWGGPIGVVPVSALTGMGMEELLERIILEAEMLELKADPTRPANGVVLEAKLEQGLGPTASVLVQGGTLKIGDPVLCGGYAGKVRSLIDDKGDRVKTAGPSCAVQIIGLSGVPEAGEKFRVCQNEREAKDLAETHADSLRQDSLSTPRGASMEDLFSQMKTEKKNSLRVIIKSDVRGSGEAIAESLSKLPSDKISVNVVHQGVGAITDNDVLLAAASKAIIVGFHVRVNSGVNALAKREGVEIRLYSVIYHLIEDIEEAMLGRLEPEKREIPVGSGHILKIFEMTKGPAICGSMIDSGYVRTGTKVRVHRGDELLFNGEVKSLRRFQDDVKEVKQGLECGIRLDNFKDFEEGDVLKFYEVKTEKATL